MRFLTYVISASLFMTAAPPAVAEALSGAQDFSFKRIKVGAGLPGKRITVQIDPVEQARLLALAPKVEPRKETEAAPAAPAPLSPTP